MKSSSSLAALVAALTLTGSAFPFTPKGSVPQNAAPTTKLTPSKIVRPSNLPSSFTRQVVDVEFSLDAEGQPQDVTVTSRSAAAVKQQIVKAFKQWKFEPVAPRGERTEGQRFVLPLDIVPEV